MKIVRLEAQNVLNIKAIEIQADGKSVVLSGKNEVGKSSIIDSIMMALTGKMVERPIKDGEKKAEVKVDLGDYKIKRVWTEAGNRLEITSNTKEGAIVTHKSPQALLNGILGALSFDPLAFKAMDDKGQRELLMRLVGLDFGKEGIQRQDLYNERTAKNRMLGNYKSNLMLTKAPESGLPNTETSLVEELQKIERLENSRMAHVEMIGKKKMYEELIKKNREEIDKRHKLDRQQVEMLQEQIRTIEKMNIVAVTDLDKERHAIEADLKKIQIPDEIKQEDIDKARAILSNVEATNAKIRNAVTYKDWKTKADAAQKEVDDLTVKIEAIDKDKVEKITKAQYPVAGLAVDENCVLYKGIPFSQASDGMKVRISTSIAMKLNPTVRIILIKEGSFLDSDGIKAITEMAKENDYQLWIEKVSDEKEIGIKIED